MSAALVRRSGARAVYHEMRRRRRRHNTVEPCSFRWDAGRAADSGDGAGALPPQAALKGLPLLTVVSRHAVDAARRPSNASDRGRPADWCRTWSTSFASRPPVAARVCPFGVCSRARLYMIVRSGCAPSSRHSTAVHRTTITITAASATTRPHARNAVRFS